MPSKAAVAIGAAVVGVIAVVTVSVTRPDGSATASPTTLTIPLEPPAGRSCPAYPAFPDASCTGVTPGVQLEKVNGDLVVATDFAVITGKDVDGCVLVNAVGVTVKDTKAKCITTTYNARARNPQNPRLTVQDVEIDCGDSPAGWGSSGIGDQNVNVYRANIQGCENGFDMDGHATIKDSYIHDLFTMPDDTPNGPHMGVLQSAFGNNLVIEHNTMYAFDTGCVYPDPQGHCNGSGVIGIHHESGPPLQDTFVRNNLMAGGSYVIRCPRYNAGMTLEGNQFSTVYSPKVGEFGVSDDCGDERLSGNVIHETGERVTLD